MIFHTKTREARCRCERCQTPGTEGDYIGTQAMRGGSVYWYCPQCWESMRATLTTAQVRARVRR